MLSPRPPKRMGPGRGQGSLEGGKVLGVAGVLGGGDRGFWEEGGVRGGGWGFWEEECRGARRRGRGILGAGRSFERRAGSLEKDRGPQEANFWVCVSYFPLGPWSAPVLGKGGGGAVARGAVAKGMWPVELRPWSGDCGAVACLC